MGEGIMPRAWIEAEHVPRHLKAERIRADKAGDGQIVGEGLLH
ncbi:MAG: hypothetical protein ACE362_20635 [Phaeodactylibacter xiamenensis]|nr:hypothetical protein [Phaeodactylibacter xiamenensis]MCR9055087.1 hypothetical protein [bacterium]